VRAARAVIDGLGLPGLEVVEADAGRSEAYVGTPPGDLALACGIFGNISEHDIARTIAFLPARCAPGGRVIWTRDPGLGPDVLDRIPRWFDAAGFEPGPVVIGEGGIFGVGTAQLRAEPPPLRAGEELFTFLR
jgi:hypothetical protein